MKPSQIPKISIITPSYNQAQFITKTIESVIGQHDPLVAYFVFDGASSDETPKVLRSYEHDLEWESKKDRGQSDALNKGWKRVLSAPLSDDDIIAYINSDDYYLPDAFSKVRAAFAKHPDKLWLVGDAVIVDTVGHEIQQPIRMYKRLFRWLFIPAILGILNPLPQPAVFIRASAAKKVGLFNEKLQYTMDYEYWLRLLRQVGAPLFLNQPLAAFRIHQTSKGTTQYISQFQEEYLVAGQFTSNRLVLFLHKLHTWCIFALYKRMK